eukprot:1193948-Prorocentrum_minimum.AAC.3
MLYLTTNKTLDVTAPSHRVGFSHLEVHIVPLFCPRLLCVGELRPSLFSCPRPRLLLPRCSRVCAPQLRAEALPASIPPSLPPASPCRARPPSHRCLPQTREGGHFGLATVAAFAQCAPPSLLAPPPAPPHARLTQGMHGVTGVLACQIHRQSLKPYDAPDVPGIQLLIRLLIHTQGRNTLRAAITHRLIRSPWIQLLHPQSHPYPFRSFTPAPPCSAPGRQRPRAPPLRGPWPLSLSPC